MNGSFNAYLMDDYPELAGNIRNLSVMHSFELNDDLKEYWGFHLKNGSKITLKSCSQ